MGTIYNRGTRAKPNFWGKYKARDGEWKAIKTNKPTKTQARDFIEQIESRIADGKVGIEQDSDNSLVGVLMAEWLEGLNNRNAQDDRTRCRKHLIPVFGKLRISEIGVPRVLRWIDKMAKGDLSGGSQRHNLNCLSRFFSWAIGRGLASYNPVKQIPQGQRPNPAAKTIQPWIDDENMVRRILLELKSLQLEHERKPRVPKGPPIDRMFYLGNRSGMRTGEICGIRMGDFEFLEEGVIRIRHSYDGVLKEDKGESGKTKWVPADDGCKEYFNPWLQKRKDDGATSDSYVFPSPRNAERPSAKEWVGAYWNKVRTKLELDTTWYQATRHSFCSRLLKAGATLDEVSSALGHSSPAVTRRYYDHFIRKSYSSKFREKFEL